MTDTARRKDLIYPTSDTQAMNSAQFESDSTPSPTHQHNGMLPHKSPTTIDVDNGFSSEEEVEKGSEVFGISRSCGQAELKKLRKELNDKQLTGKYIELPMSEDLISDERVQSTYTLFTKHGSKSLPRHKSASVSIDLDTTSPPHTSMSNHSSPSDSSYLSPLRNNVRSASPDIGRKIQSNPFFVQDRISRSNVDRQRLDSAPANMSLKVKGTTEVRSSSSLSTTPSLSTSKSFSHNIGNQVRDSADPLASVNIQSRIRLWADKEKEASEIKELERIKSPISQKSTNSPSPQKSRSNTPTKKVDDSISSSKIPVKDVEHSNKKVNKHKNSLGDGKTSPPSPSRSPSKDSRSRSGSKESSSELSPEASPKKSRWKLKSPLFRRKKASDSLSFDSEQSDESTLSGSNEKLETNKKTRNISNRSKRKAVKKRLSDAFGLPRSNSELKTAVDDQAIPTSKPPLPDTEFRKRSTSLGPKQRIRTNQRRATSQPDIHKHSVHSPEMEGDYMIVISKHLDPETQTIMLTNKDALPNSNVVLREEKGQKDAETKTKTISRDIRDIINSLGTSNLDIDKSEAVSESVLSPELESVLEQTASESQLDVVISPPPPLADNGGLVRVPSLFSEDDETFIPGGGSAMDPLMMDPLMSDPLMSSLDIGPTQRAAIKRRLSDQIKATHSTGTKLKLGPRTVSLSPTEEDTSDGVIATSLMYADAVWDRVALDEDELSFGVGDAIEILNMTDDVWWYGSVNSANGWFPASFVRLRIGQDSDEDNDSVISTDPPSSPSAHDTPPPPQPTTLPPKTEDTPSEDAPSEDKLGELASEEKRRPSRHQSGSSVHRRMTIRRKDSAPSLPRKLTSNEVRAKVIEEILNTERDYVKHLEDIIEGYVKRCLGYNKLFDNEKVDTIFSNIEAIYTFQRDFLHELESSINHDKIEDSQIGEVFVNNRHEFDIYGQYCNNHPHAVNEMNQLQENEQYKFFFESCRLLRNLQDISLEGFLLTPVQKICKYPLQLTELLKYTSEDHPDHSHIVAARDAMREVALHINEMKRRMENIGKIGRWQATIEGWKGEDILASSSQMLRCGELHKISKGHSQERHFFLFDHQLIYCKKDAIGGKLTYKGRVYLDQCQVTDMDDGKAQHSGSVVKNSWRMKNKDKDKWYIIFAKSSEDKRDWMDSFEKERELVKDDEEKKFHVSLKMKRSAVALTSSSEQLRRGRRKSSTTPVKGRANLLESVDSGTRHKLSAQRLVVSASSPQVKSKTASKKKRGSNS